MVVPELSNRETPGRFACHGYGYARKVITSRERSMNENDLFQRVEELVNEEKSLRSRTSEDGLSDEDLQRLRAVEERLDQCWDLLRQRRAKAEFGEDPAEAEPRPVGEVESYKQ
jgi:hypothetical protein